MTSITRSVLATILAATAFAATLDAQRRGRDFRRSRAPSENSRNHDLVKEVFRSVVAAARRSTVIVKCDGKQVALGTIVDADGYIVTKTSELRDGEILCTLTDGVDLIATRLGDHYDNDLVLLKVAAKKLVPVQWADGDGDYVGVDVGSWVASPATGTLPAAIGVMSAEVHDRHKSKFRSRGRGGRGRGSTERAYLGIMSSMRDSGVRLDEVQKGTAADAAGLKVGDIVLEFEDLPIRDPDEFVTRIGRRRVGQKVSIKVRRGAKELVVEATLGRDPQQTEDRRGPVSSRQAYWGPLSDVRVGFTEVIQHDSVLRPDQCGGPLVNLDGKVVGVNISRVGRIETLALTGRAVRKMLADLK